MSDFLFNYMYVILLGVFSVTFWVFILYIFHQERLELAEKKRKKKKKR